MKKTKFVIVCGFAGSGKTWLCKQLVKTLNYTYVNKDTICDGFTNYILKNEDANQLKNRDSEFYKTIVKPIEYEQTLAVCDENLSLGNNVILDSPLTSVISNYKKFNEYINLKKYNKQNIEVKVVWIKHNINIEHERILKRNASRDEYKIKNWNTYVATIKTFFPSKKINAYIFNNESETAFKCEFEKLKNWITK